MRRGRGGERSQSGCQKNEKQPKEVVLHVHCSLTKKEHRYHPTDKNYRYRETINFLLVCYLLSFSFSFSLDREMDEDLRIELKREASPLINILRVFGILCFILGAAEVTFPVWILFLFEISLFLLLIVRLD